jgi:hypothetical protein
MKVPNEAIAELIAGPNASLPWFIDANALAKLFTGQPSESQNARLAESITIKQAVRQFILGGRGGGAPAHPHSHALNSIAYGLKRWRMWSPHSSHFSAVSPWFGWNRNEGSQDFVECTQHGGDMMYVPALWGHSVLNLQDSVGQTIEFEVQVTGEEL